MPTPVKISPSLKQRLTMALDKLVGDNGTTQEKLDRLYDRILNGNRGSVGITDEFAAMCQEKGVEILEIGTLGTLREITNLAV